MNEDQQQRLAALAAHRWRVALSLTAAMIAVYFGFILLVAFEKPFLATLVLGGRVSVGILLGAAVIVAAPLLIAIYVRWANRVYDPEVMSLYTSLSTSAPRIAAGTPPMPLPPHPPARATTHREEARP